MGFPQEIIRVTEDHGTRYMRLPRTWAREHDIKRGSFLVVRETGSGMLAVTTWDKEMSNGKNTKDAKG